MKQLIAKRILVEINLRGGIYCAGKSRCWRHCLQMLVPRLTILTLLRHRSLFRESMLRRGMCCGDFLERR